MAATAATGASAATATMAAVFVPGGRAAAGACPASTSGRRSRAAAPTPTPALPAPPAAGERGPTPVARCGASAARPAARAGSSFRSHAPQPGCAGAPKGGEAAVSTFDGKRRSLARLEPTSNEPQRHRTQRHRTQRRCAHPPRARQHQSNAGATPARVTAPLPLHRRALDRDALARCRSSTLHLDISVGRGDARVSGFLQGPAMAGARGTARRQEEGAGEAGRRGNGRRRSGGIRALGQTCGVAETARAIYGR